jgi:DNA-binding transcriptional ArsR family regulator
VGAITQSSPGPAPDTAADVDRVLAALADSTRRRLLEELSARRARSASALAVRVPVSRQAIAKHLTVLQEAGLVTGRRAGREIVFDVQAERLRTTASWMSNLAAAWDARLAHLKELAESDDGTSEVRSSKATDAAGSFHDVVVLDGAETSDEVRDGNSSKPD